MIRSFIAIELEASAREQLEILQSALRDALRDPSIRWVRPGGIHLTLKFLGDQSEKALQEVGRRLTAAARGLSPFDLAIAGIGCFPNAIRPRVLWAGVQEPSGRLTSLVERIESSLSDLGFAPERRPFEPHLTLGRFKSPLRPESRKLLDLELTRSRAEPVAKSSAEVVALLRSDLRPEGAVYRVMTAAPLGVESAEVGG
jgi:2'-5' RNA ligase